MSRSWVTELRRPESYRRARPDPCTAVTCVPRLHPHAPALLWRAGRGRSTEPLPYPQVANACLAHPSAPMPSGMQPQGVPARPGDVSDPALFPSGINSAFVGGMGAGKAKDMPQRNRRVQRAARQQLVNDGGSRTPMHVHKFGAARESPGSPPARTMLADGVWSRYGRWIHGTDDWTRWRFRCGTCVRLRPRTAATVKELRPETVL